MSVPPPVPPVPTNDGPAPTGKTLVASAWWSLPGFDQRQLAAAFVTKR